MEGYIQSMSVYASEILEKHSEGRIHSIYKKTINLSLGKELLSFQPSGTHQTPLSLILNLQEEDFEAVELETGALVKIESGRLQAGNLCLFTKGAVLKDCQLSRVLLPEKITSVRECFEKSLCREKQSVFSQTLFGGEEEQTKILAGILKERLTEAEFHLKNHRWEEASDCLCTFIGLGIGLTPGGDDFLCGILSGLEMAGLHRHPFSNSLHRKIAKNLGRTNDISCAFLKCALDGQYGQLIHDFYQENAEKIVWKARKIGHSSGIDMLFGIFYLFTQQQNVKLI